MCLYMCVFVCVGVFVFVCVFVCVSASVCELRFVDSAYVCEQVDLRANWMCVCVYVCIGVRVYVCVLVYLSVCDALVCVCVFLCVSRGSNSLFVIQKWLQNMQIYPHVTFSLLSVLRDSLWPARHDWLCDEA